MANVDQFIMQMQMQGIDKVDASAAALMKFESQIKNEQAALDGLKAKFDDASNNVFEFTDRLAGAKSKLDAIRSGKEKFDPKAYGEASNEVSKFGASLDKAKGVQDKLKASMDAKSAGIGALKEASTRINGTGEAAKTTATTIDKMRDAIGGAEGASGKFSAALKALPPQAQAIVAGVTAMIAVLTAAIAVLVSWTSAAIASAQGRDALISTFNALGKERGAGAAALEVTSKLSKELPFATSKLNEWAKSLLQSGVAGKDLEKGIRSVASASAIMGEEGAATILDFKKQLAQSQFVAAAFVAQVKMGGPEMVSRLASMGLQAKDLARQLGVSPQQMKGMALTAAQLGTALDAALRVKGAQALENLGLTWEVIKTKFDEGLGSIFADLGDSVRPFMQAIKDLFGEFNKGQPGILAAKNGMHAFLTLILSVGTKAINALHYGFLVVEVAAFQVAIAVMPIVKWLREIANNATLMKGLATIFKVIGIAALVVVAALVIIGITTLLVAGFFLAMAGIIVGAFLYIVGAIVDFFVYIDSLGPAIKEAIMHWADDAWNGAKNWINGLVKGISNGTVEVVAAVAALANSALTAFTSFFKIKSPSLVMEQMGGHVAEGAAVGIEDGGDRVEAASAGMAAKGKAGAVKGFSRGGAGKGDAGGIHIGVINFHGNKEDIPDFMSQLTAAIESLRNQGPKPVPA